MPQAIRVLSENNLFQHADVLRRNRAKRQRYREFFVEGVQSVERVLAHGWPVTTLIYTSDRRLSKWAQEILDRSTAGVHLDMSMDLLSQLSEKPETSEILALVEMPPDDLSRIPIAARDLLVVVFDRPSNHGNLGTVIRSCDAFQAGGVIAVGHAVDLYDPRTVRASIGSLFTLPVLRVASPRHLVPWLDALKAQWPDLQVVGSSAKAERDVGDMDMTRPTVLVVGNETVGMSQNLRALCDQAARIPIWGSASSLNVACATSILLYEVDRQRRVCCMASR